MQGRIKAELAQIPVIDGDKTNNLARVLAAIDSAASDTDLLLLPECSLSGFPTAANRSQLAEPVDGASLTAVRRAAKNKGISVVLGFTEADKGRFFNTTVLIEPEQGVVLKYRKTHLWPGERGIVEAGDRLVTTCWKGIRVGILICYDIEFPETARALGQLGAELLLVTNGNFDPYASVHRACIMARAVENQAFALMVNRCGTDNGLAFCGGSAAVDPFGKLLAEAGRDETRIRLSLDLAQLTESRKNYSYQQHQRIKLPGQLIERNGCRELLIASK